MVHENRKGGSDTSFIDTAAAASSDGSANSDAACCLEGEGEKDGSGGSRECSEWRASRSSTSSIRPISSSAEEVAEEKVEKGGDDRGSDPTHAHTYITHQTSDNIQHTTDKQVHSCMCECKMMIMVTVVADIKDSSRNRKRRRMVTRTRASRTLLLFFADCELEQFLLRSV
jgi:hypothetical protein